MTVLVFEVVWVICNCLWN